MQITYALLLSLTPSTLYIPHIRVNLYNNIIIIHQLNKIIFLILTAIK